jgi:hypothetical protein
VSRPDRPLPPPLEGNDRVITGTITGGFAVALIVLLILRGQLPQADRWWIWVAAFGTFLGLFGFVWVPILKRQRDRAAARRQVTAEHVDTGPADTGPADTGPADTGQAAMGQAAVDQVDIGPADGGPAETGNAGTERAGQPDGARRP